MSKTADANPMQRLRIKFWMRSFVDAHGGTQPEVDEDLNEYVRGPKRRRRVPNFVQERLNGRELRRSLHGVGMEEFVRAGTLRLGDETPEQKYFSPFWLPVIPAVRTAKFVSQQISEFLRDRGLWRLSQSKSKGFIELLDRSLKCHLLSGQYAARLREAQIERIVRFASSGSISTIDAAVLMVLLHQEAHLTCQIEAARLLRAMARPLVRNASREFFRGASPALREEIEACNQAMFWPNPEVKQSRPEMIQSARFVSGLIYPSVSDESGKRIYRPTREQVWRFIARLEPPPPRRFGSGGVTGSG
jgi:hypothetical protein